MNATPVVAYLQVGVMVLLMRNPGQGIDEGDGLVIVLEAVAALDFIAVIAERPVGMNLRKQGLHFVRLQLAGFPLTVFF